jgi:hypothetical protein
VPDQTCGRVRIQAESPERQVLSGCRPAQLGMRDPQAHTPPRRRRRSPTQRLSYLFGWLACFLGDACSAEDVRHGVVRLVASVLDELVLAIIVPTNNLSRPPCDGRSRWGNFDRDARVSLAASAIVRSRRSDRATSRRRCGFMRSRMTQHRAGSTRDEPNDCSNRCGLGGACTEPYAARRSYR